MLRAFTLQNFQSFRAPVRISLELNRHAPDDHRACMSAAGARLTKAIAVIGANASGKTALIKSLVFVDWFMKRSFQAEPDAPIPLTPHFSAQDEDSIFELEFELDEREWRYRLVASKDRVRHESLYARPQHSRAFSYVFTRDWHPERNGYAVRQQQFGLRQKEAEKVRENASLISTAAQYEVELALKLVSINMLSNVRYMGRSTDFEIPFVETLNASERYAENSDLRGQMVSLLCQWDLGLADVRIENRTTKTVSGEIKETHIPFGIHRISDQEHSLPFIHESSGTRGAFVLLSRILPALQQPGGGLVVIDELEADLHPHMLTPILDLFFSPETNPHNVQIIFTSHSIEVLNLLHKAQVVLVEKDGNCESDAWRLDSVKGVRADDNLYAKYMAGAYGAIPRL